MIYHVDIQPDGAYWNIRVPAIKRSTQARTLNEVDDMAKDLISIMTEETAPQIDVQMHLPEEVEDARKLKAQAEDLERQAKASQRNAIRKLHGEGMPYREIGKILGISHQRAQQLATI